MTTNEITTAVETHLEETYEAWNHNLDEGQYEYTDENGNECFFCWDTESDILQALRNAGIEI